MASAATMSSQLTHIDLSTLSHSELQSLSHLSSSFPPSSSTTTTTTTTTTTQEISHSAINPSTFNESPGSLHHRRRSTTTIQTGTDLSSSSNGTHSHNRHIMNRLKTLISRHPNFHSVELLSPALPPPAPPPRKRGRKPKSLTLTPSKVVGSSVDLVGLGESVDPFGEELRKRTLGVESEEGLLGFMRGVEGQWGSRRKRRRIVDASLFAVGVLPFGWKILLGIRRKEGRAWIYCRRYISPTGQHFINCKDVALYLQSISSQSTTHPDYGQRVEDIQVDRREWRESKNHAGLIFKDGDQRHDVNSSSTIPTFASASNGHGNENILLDIENLADVQIQDLFECHKCNVTFDEKDSYLQHLLSIHQRTTRRYKLGSSVSEGVIIKDGKYECQFCHKVFLERRRYNGHVGIHVRNFVRGVDEAPDSSVQEKPKSPPRDESSSRISKMDALIEIAQNSILETSYERDDGPHKSSEKLVSSESAVPINVDPSLGVQELDDMMIDQDHSDQIENDNVVIDESTEKVDGTNGMIDVKVVSVLELYKSSTEHERVSSVSANEVDKATDDNNCELKIDDNDTAQNPTKRQLLPASSHEVSEKVEQLFGIEPEMESLKYSFADVEESANLQDVPIELANSSEMESVFGASSSIQLESEEVTLNRDQTTTDTDAVTVLLCVWCGTEIEFNNNVVDPKLQQDSVGFMCQNCKSKVTVHNTALDNGSPVSPHSL